MNGFVSMLKLNVVNYICFQKSSISQLYTNLFFSAIFGSISETQYLMLPLTSVSCFAGPPPTAQNSSHSRLCVCVCEQKEVTESNRKSRKEVPTEGPSF
jgi:hypothetical protein